MTFDSVLSILRGWLAIALLLCCGAATAATINFNGGNVSGCTRSGSTYSCSSAPNVNDTDVISIANGYTVVVSTAVSFSYNQGLKMSGTAKLQTSGDLNIGDINSSNLSISGGTLTTSGNFKIGNQAQTITANVNAATMTVGTGSTTKITGTLNATGEVDLGSHVTIVGPITATVVTTNSPVSISGNVSATTSFQLASGSQLSGSLSSPQVTLDSSGVTVTGNITAATSLTIGSGNTVNGTVTGGTLSLASSNVVVNGDVNMTGDISIGASDTINGNLTGHNVTTHASGDYISGNAQVNAIYLDWGATVGKVITCTGAPAGSPDCSCVTRADSNYHPTCSSSPPPPSLPDHFQITHSGSALTCQPQTVTITACANATCSTLYTSPATVTTFPGGQQFNVTGGVNNAATVQQSQAGTATLSATGATNANTCVNTGGGSPCQMNFQTDGLIVTATNHVSMTTTPSPGPLVTIQAKGASQNNQSCVPLIANQTVNINIACTYSDPNTGTNVMLDSSSLVCGSNGPGAYSPVSFNFDGTGTASVPLQYAEVGKVNLTASYSTAKFTATGSGSFIAAPAKFLVLVTSTNATHPPAIGPMPLTGFRETIFAKASEQMSITIRAVNAINNDTTNFGKESSPQSVDFGWAVMNPANSSNLGSLTYSQMGAFINGVSTTQISFSDVGYLKFTPKLTNTYYMGYQNASFQTQGLQYVSRIIPDHFDTALLTNTDIAAINKNIVLGLSMDCAPQGSPLSSSLNPCTASGNSNNGSFVNSGQPFFMKVLAYNGASPPAPTQNYAGDLVKTITVSAASPNGGAALTSGSVNWSGADPKFSFAAGIGMIATPGPSNPNLPAFSFTQAYPAADVLPLTIYLRAQDADNVTSQRSNAASSVEAPLTVVSGRLQVTNNYGSLTSPLPVKVNAQYFMPSGYVFNSQVNATSGAVAGAISFSNCQKGLVINGSCPATLKTFSNTDPLQLANGTGTFLLAAPSPTLTDKGSVDVTLKAPGATGAQLIPYLPSATGRETFGIYRSGPVIYTREVH